MLGIAYNANSSFILKSNIATGFRSPNLAELSSNGLHEGVYRYEIGDPDLKTEQNINLDMAAEYNIQQVFLSIAAFRNMFYNYVYLTPTDEKFYGYPVFRFRQQNVLLYGGEAFLTLKPEILKWIQFKEAFTYTHGQLADGTYLPFIPAYKFSSAIRYEKKLSGKVSNFYFEPEFVYVFKQDRPAQFETSTPEYFLFNLSSAIILSHRKGDWKIGLNITNLTNTKYADHLSRLKYYGLYNQGINIVVSIRKELKW